MPQAVTLVLPDYAGLTWSDAAERGGGIGAAMQEFLMRRDPPEALGLSEQEGEIAGISYRVRGAGPPLVLPLTRYELYYWPTIRGDAVSSSAWRSKRLRPSMSI